jgi:chromosome segregation ATPase
MEGDGLYATAQALVGARGEVERLQGEQARLKVENTRIRDETQQLVDMKAALEQHVTQLTARLSDLRAQVAPEERALMGRLLDLSTHIAATQEHLQALQYQERDVERVARAQRAERPDFMRETPL